MKLLAKSKLQQADGNSKLPFDAWISQYISFLTIYIKRILFEATVLKYIYLSFNSLQIINYPVSCWEEIRPKYAFIGFNVLFL